MDHPGICQRHQTAILRWQLRAESGSLTRRATVEQQWSTLQPVNSNESTTVHCQSKSKGIPDWWATLHVEWSVVTCGCGSQSYILKVLILVGIGVSISAWKQGSAARCCSSNCKQTPLLQAQNPCDSRATLRWHWYEEARSHWTRSQLQAAKGNWRKFDSQSKPWVLSAVQQ